MKKLILSFLFLAFGSGCGSGFQAPVENGNIDAFSASPPPTTPSPSADPNELSNVTLSVGVSGPFEFTKTKFRNGDLVDWMAYANPANLSAPPRTGVSFVVTGADLTGAETLELVDQLAPGKVLTAVSCFSSALCALGMDFHAYYKYQLNCPPVSGTPTPSTFFYELQPGSYWLRMIYKDGTQKQTAVSFPSHFPACTKNIVAVASDKDSTRLPASVSEEQVINYFWLIVSGGLFLFFAAIFVFFKLLRKT